MIIRQFTLLYISFTGEQFVHSSHARWCVHFVHCMLLLSCFQEYMYFDITGLPSRVFSVWNPSNMKSHYMYCFFYHNRMIFQNNKRKIANFSRPHPTPPPSLGKKILLRTPRNQKISYLEKD